jgi:hypothetical protein
MSRRSNRHHAERGQAVPIVALALVLLIGATALAVDLSLQTHTRRSLQNVSDAAALAGARELKTQVDCTQEKSAVTASLSAIQSNLGLAQGWASTPGCNSQGSSETIANYTLNGTTYNVTVNTPPQQTSNSALKCTNNAASDAQCKHFVEVVVSASSTGNNPFSGFLGFGASTEGARSIGYHSGPDVKFGFALFADTITTGNGQSGEIVSGNVYAKHYVAPQSSGQAGFCADSYPNPNGNGNLPGYVLLGFPQKNDSGYQNDGQWDLGGPNAKQIVSNANCNSTSAGTVNETGQVGGAAGCPSSISGVPNANSLVYNSTVMACEYNPALSAPAFEAPTHSSPGGNNCTTGAFCYVLVDPGRNGITWSTTGNGQSLPMPTTSGLYDIPHTCNSNGCTDLTIDVGGGPATLNGITLYLEAGALVQVQGANTLTVIPYNAGTATSNPNDKGVYAVYGAGTGATLTIKGGGQQAQTVFLVPAPQGGSVIMEGGTVNQVSNGWLDLEGGQAVVSNWNEQSGNHPQTIISYSAGGGPSEPEVLALVQ